MRASGIGLHRTMLPFLWVGAAMSVLSLVLNETVTPAAKEWASAFLKNNFRPAPPPGLRLCKFYSSATHREWTIQKFDPRRPSLLIGVEVEQERADATRREIVSAPRAEWLDGQWWFYNARVQQFDENEDPLANPVRLGGWYSVREMRNFTERPSDFLSQTKEWEFLTTPQMIRYVQIQPQMSGELPRKLFHIHRRMALPWACLVVTLFGIPTGARGSRRSALAGMFAAMALFAGFYAVTQIGTYLGMRGLTWPWMGAWFANITFGLAGAWLSIEVR
jgi:lipopolysaccharide export system permease protein